MRHGPSAGVVQTSGDVSQQGPCSDGSNVCGVVHGKLLEVLQIHDDSTVDASVS